MLRIVSSSLVLVSSVSSLIACSDIERHGTIEVCYAYVETEGGEPIDDDFRTTEQSRVGLHPADPDTSWAAPARFTDCAATIADAASTEFIDQNGAHLWLAVDIVVRGERLISPAVFADIEDGRLDIAGARGFGSSDTLKLTSLASSNDPEVRLALQNGLPLDEDLVGLPAVSDEGADGLAANNGCSSVTARKLRFLGLPIEVGGVVLKNGEIGTVDGQIADYTVSNIAARPSAKTCRPTRPSIRGR